MGFGEPVALDVQRQRRLLQVAKLSAQVIADHTIDNEGAIYFQGCGKSFAAGKIPPFLTANDTAGFNPLMLRSKLCGYIRAGGSYGPDSARFIDDVHDAQGQLIDLVEVGAHALEHDFLFDIYHVAVAQPFAVHHFAHLHASLQLVGLRLHGEDTNLARFEIVQHGLRHIYERARSKFFEHKGVVRAAARRELRHQAGGNLFAGTVGDESDLFRGLDLQADCNGVVRTGRQLRIECPGAQETAHWAMAALAGSRERPASV